MATSDAHPHGAIAHFDIEKMVHRERPLLTDEQRAYVSRDLHIPKFRQLQSEGASKADRAYQPDRDLTYVARVRRYLREPLAEFLATMVLVIIGDASVCQVRISEFLGTNLGSYTSIAFSWAVAVLLGILIAAGTTGAHLNPSVTIANALFRRFPWRRVPIYIAAQMLGGFVGCLIVFANYRAGIAQVEGSYDVLSLKTAGYFATLPATYISKTSQVFSEVLDTAILIGVLFAVGDPKNLQDGAEAGPFYIFWTIFALGAALGTNTGYALNMARDTAPRIALSVVGYPSEIWTAYGYYSTVPIYAPIVGAIIGGLVYDTFIYEEDSPVNRPYFGYYEWRWRHATKNAADATANAVNDAMDAVATTLPDAMVPDALLARAKDNETSDASNGTTSAEKWSAEEGNIEHAGSNNINNSNIKRSDSSGGLSTRRVLPYATFAPQRFGPADYTPEPRRGSQADGVAVQRPRSH